MPLLFSYGTLQDAAVQLATFKRLLAGHADALPGYEPSQVRIADPSVADRIGRTHHANVLFTGRQGARVAGTALEVSDSELEAADDYERAASYMRVRVMLASGREAWVYVWRSSFRFDEALPVLERTPRVTRALLAGLPERWVGASEGAATWTPSDVVGHLIHGERTNWLPRVEHLLQHGDAVPFPPFDREAMLAASAGRQLDRLLDEFAALRDASLRRLAALGLTDEDLTRRGRHPEFGVVTLAQHLSTWVAHDLGHIVQIARVMARQYEDAVGPWRAYLSVLRRS